MQAIDSGRHNGAMARARIRIDLVPDGESSPDTRRWRVQEEGSDVGRLRADHRDGDVTIHVEVVTEARGRGVARVAVGRLLGMAPWGPDVRYVAVLDPTDVAAVALAHALAFRPEDLQPDDLQSVDLQLGGSPPDSHRVWTRPAPRPRAAAGDITRFLDASGRIDRYPLRAGDRRELLEWVAERSLPVGAVLDERRVNEALAPFAPGGDVAVLRRYLVDHGLVARTASGSEYVREA